MSDRVILFPFTVLPFELTAKRRAFFEKEKILAGDTASSLMVEKRCQSAG